MQNQNATELVVPGDRLGIEEEFAAGDNTFIDDDGAIRAAITGYASVDQGRINVHNNVREIKKVEKGMFVIGTVTDDMHSVVFVKIGPAHLNGVEHIATKDGKIVMVQKTRDRDRGPPHGGRDSRGRDREETQHTKMCGVGDVVIARVLFDDPEVYTLGIREPETGVVHSRCEMCGSGVKKVGEGALKCIECEHTQMRKLSVFFDKPDEIKRLFK